MVSTKIGMASFRVSNFKAGDNDDVLRQELDLTEEKWDQAYLKSVAYKQRITQYFNWKVRHRSFLVEELVLKVVNKSTKVLSHGKLNTNWEVPYIFTQVT